MLKNTRNLLFVGVVTLITGTQLFGAGKVAIGLIAKNASGNDMVLLAKPRPEQFNVFGTEARDGETLYDAALRSLAYCTGDAYTKDNVKQVTVKPFGSNAIFIVEGPYIHTIRASENIKHVTWVPANEFLAYPNAYPIKAKRSKNLLQETLRNRQQVVSVQPAVRQPRARRRTKPTRSAQRRTTTRRPAVAPKESEAERQKRLLAEEEQLAWAMRESLKMSEEAPRPQPTVEPEAGPSRATLEEMTQDTLALIQTPSEHDVHFDIVGNIVESIKEINGIHQGNPGLEDANTRIVLKFYAKRGIEETIGLTDNLDKEEIQFDRLALPLNYLYQRILIAMENRSRDGKDIFQGLADHLLEVNERHAGESLLPVINATIINRAYELTQDAEQTYKLSEGLLLNSELLSDEIQAAFTAYRSQPHGATPARRPVAGPSEEPQRTTQPTAPTQLSPVDRLLAQMTANYQRDSVLKADNYILLTRINNAIKDLRHNEQACDQANSRIVNHFYALTGNLNETMRLRAAMRGIIAVSGQKFYCYTDDKTLHRDLQQAINDKYKIKPSDVEAPAPRPVVQTEVPLTGAIQNLLNEINYPPSGQPFDFSTLPAKLKYIREKYAGQQGLSHHMRSILEPLTSTNSVFRQQINRNTHSELSALLQTLQAPEETVGSATKALIAEIEEQKQAFDFSTLVKKMKAIADKYPRAQMTLKVRFSKIVELVDKYVSEENVRHIIYNAMGRDRLPINFQYHSERINKEIGFAYQ